MQNYFAYQFGVGSDMPVPGYYDGDQLMDVAVFRESDGVWYILRSDGGGAMFEQFGMAGDIPAPHAFVK
jgi:hypothetical protein